jgi:hypothetical protein
MDHQQPRLGAKCRKFHVVRPRILEEAKFINGESAGIRIQGKDVAEERIRRLHENAAADIFTQASPLMEDSPTPAVKHKLRVDDDKEGMLCYLVSSSLKTFFRERFCRKREANSKVPPSKEKEGKHCRRRWRKRGESRWF